MDLTREKVFDRRWGMTLLDQALKRLREEFTAAGKTRHFELLKGFLTSEAAAGAYDGIAMELQTTPNAIAVNVRRLRLRYRELVQAEVARTACSPTDMDEELRALFG